MRRCASPGLTLVCKMHVWEEKVCFTTALGTLLLSTQAGTPGPGAFCGINTLSISATSKKTQKIL